MHRWLWKSGKMIVGRYPRQMGRRVVAEQNQLDALHAHDPIGLRPAAVVADAHADIGAERAPHRKAEIARLEIPLLQMLERVMRAVVGMTGQMHLAVLADDLGVLVHQDRRVVAMRGALRAAPVRRSRDRSRSPATSRLRTAAGSPDSAFPARRSCRSRRHLPSTSAERRWSAPIPETPPCRCRAPWPRASVRAAGRRLAGAIRRGRSVRSGLRQH